MTFPKIERLIASVPRQSSDKVPSLETYLTDRVAANLKDIAQDAEFILDVMGTDQLTFQSKDGMKISFERGKGE